MFELLWQRLDTGARHALPFVTTLLCTLLSVMAWPLPHFGAIAPPLGLIALYYWSLHRPDLFGPGMAFLIGRLNDILHNLDPGTSALLFVLAHQAILHQRRFFAGHSFFMMWAGFALIALIVMGGEWLALCLLHWQMFPFFPVLVQTLLAIVIFPLPYWLFIRLQRAALSQG